MTRLLESIYIGFVTPFTGIKLMLGKKKLFFISIIPIVINILLYLAFAALVYHYYSDIVALVVRDPDTLLRKILYWSFFAFFLLFVLTFFIFTFTIVGSIILAPFNSLIAERTYKMLRQGAVDAPNNTTFLRSSYDSIKLEVKKLVIVFIPIFCLYIAGIFLPIVAVIAFVLGFWAVTFEYMDYIIEQKNIKISDRMKIMLSHPIQCTAFGFVASIMVSIPVLGLICIPSTVVGATALFVNIEKRS